MSNKFVIPLPPVVGAAASATATLDLPVGPRYHVIWLKLATAAGITPTLAAALGDIKLKVNGRVQRIFSATQLNALQTLFGPAFSATYAVDGAPTAQLGYVQADGKPSTWAAPLTPVTTSDGYVFRLPIFLCEPWRKQYSAEDLYAWPTAWNGRGAVATFQLELSCGASMSTGGITAYAEVDYVNGASDTNGSPIMQISKWNRFEFVHASGTNDLYIITLPRQGIYQQVSLFTADTAKYVNSVKVKVENNLIRDINKPELDASLWARGMNPHTLAVTRADIVFDYDDAPTNALPMVYGGKLVQDFQIIPNITADAAGTVTALVNTFGPLD